MTVESSKNDKKTPFFMVALVMLALVNIILVYLMMQSKEESINKDVFIEKQKNELEETGEKLDSINRELEIRIAEAKESNQDYQELLDMQEQLKKDIALAKKEKLDVEALLKKYDAKIKKYEALLKEKEGIIENLEGENKELNEKISQTETEKARLESSIESSEKEKEVLKSTLAKAAILKAESIKLEGLDSKNRVSEGNKFKAKKLEKLKVYINIAENNASKAGNREIFMRVIEPSGAVIVGSEGGRFKDAQGKEQNYTISTDFAYSYSNRSTSLIFRKGNNFQKGTHQVELYCEGYLLGKTNFEVR
ncbi:MAG: hypothetical protein SFU27_10720 [Thermonemataceae bacterium]|nr:hypothetical protein [Thermonemataceae bacterium]